MSEEQPGDAEMEEERHGGRHGVVVMRLRGRGGE
jgi:hypothetical protein